MKEPKLPKLTDEGLDYYIPQVSMSAEAIEISFAEEQYSTPTAAIVTILALEVEDDPMIRNHIAMIQELCNDLIVYGYQKIVDANE